MKVSIDGQTYDYDAGRLLLSEAMLIQNKTGMRLQAWQAGLQEMDAYAVKALVFLLKLRAKENPDWDTLDFDLGALEFVEDEPAADAGPKEDGRSVSLTAIS